MKSVATMFGGDKRVAQAQNLPFKSNDAAFEYACRFCDCAPAENKSVIAQIVSSGRADGGEQVVMIRVASDGEPWETIARTCGSRGPDLQPGDLVAWRIVTHRPDLDLMPWVGFIDELLEPEIDFATGWVLKAEFPFDSES